MLLQGEIYCQANNAFNINIWSLLLGRFRLKHHAAGCRTGLRHTSMGPAAISVSARPRCNRDHDCSSPTLRYSTNLIKINVDSCLRLMNLVDFSAEIGFGMASIAPGDFLGFFCFYADQIVRWGVYTSVRLGVSAPDKRVGHLRLASLLPMSRSGHSPTEKRRKLTVRRVGKAAACWSMRTASCDASF